LKRSFKDLIKRKGNLSVIKFIALMKIGLAGKGGAELIIERFSVRII
jgi:hypothetical protein